MGCIRTWVSTLLHSMKAYRLVEKDRGEVFETAKQLLAIKSNPGDLSVDKLHVLVEALRRPRVSCRQAAQAIEAVLLDHPIQMYAEMLWYAAATHVSDLHIGDSGGSPESSVPMGRIDGKLKAIWRPVQGVFSIHPYAHKIVHAMMMAHNIPYTVPFQYVGSRSTQIWMPLPTEIQGIRSQVVPAVFEKKIFLIIICRFLYARHTAPNRSIPRPPWVPLVSACTPSGATAHETVRILRQHAQIQADFFLQCKLYAELQEQWFRLDGANCRIQAFRPRPTHYTAKIWGNVKQWLGRYTIHRKRA